MLERPIIHIIELSLNNSFMFTMFGSVNLRSIRSKLLIAGCKRIPNDRRLKSMIKNLYDDSTIGGVKFYG